MMAAVGNRDTNRLAMKNVDTLTREEIKAVADMPLGTGAEISRREMPLTYALFVRARTGDVRAQQGWDRLVAGYIALGLEPPC